MIWVLAVVVVGLIAVLAELLLSYQKRAHDLRSKQDPLRRQIRAETERMRRLLDDLCELPPAEVVEVGRGSLWHTARDT